LLVVKKENQKDRSVIYIDSCFPVVFVVVVVVALLSRRELDII